MYLTFGVYYDLENSPLLIGEGIIPLIDKLKKSGSIVYSFIHYSEYKGDHIRIWFKVNETENVEDLKKNISHHFNVFFEAYPSERTEVFPLLSSLFKYYPNNSIKFFAPTYNPFLQVPDLLNEELLDQLTAINLKLVSGKTHYNFDNLWRLGIRFYLILSYVFAGGDPMSMKRLVNKSFFDVKKYFTDKERYNMISKMAKETVQKLNTYFDQEIEILFKELSLETMPPGIDKEWMNFVSSVYQSLDSKNPDNTKLVKTYFAIMNAMKFQLGFYQVTLLHLVMVIRKLLNQQHRAMDYLAVSDKTFAEI